MKCPKCGSENVSVQVITISKLVDKHHGIFWWLLVGWWWLFIKWFFLTLPALLFKIFGHKKQKMKTRQMKFCVCQSCGHQWNY